MKKLIYSVLMGSSISIYGQNAKDIINKNIEVTGGVNKWKTLNSTILYGKVVLGPKDEFPIKIYQKRPNLSKTVVTINKKETIIEGFDGKKGYTMNYNANKLLENPTYIVENFENDFIDWEKKGFSVKYVGKEKVGNNMC